MVVINKIVSGLAFTSLLSGAFAHPGEKLDLHKIKREIAFRKHVAATNKRALDSCVGSAADTAIKARAIARRDAKLKALRQKRGIPLNAPLRRRDSDNLASYAEVDHESSESYTLDTDPATIFAQNATCVVVPETTIGPYWVAGELIRSDITDDESGVPLHLDVQFVDVTDCTGVTELLVDAWHCNATGVYSGVSATGQGGLDSTFCRGVQQTDDDGVVQFDTIFPGHYTGRTTHIHVKTTTGATVLDNNTYVDGTTNHIGQLFFDQDLISTVEAVSPYSTNEQELTENLDDSIAAGEATDDYDPFVEYVLLGDDINDGVLAWITVGIDTSADYSDQASAAAYYYEDGGVDSSDSTVGGGPDGASGAPSGSFPSGTGAPPSGTAAPSGDATSATSTAAAATSSTASSGSGPKCRSAGRRRKH